MIYRGLLNPCAVDFVANMTPWHQRNLLLFDPRDEKISALERCYYWYRARKKPEPVIIAEVNGQLRLVSGAYAWLSYGAQSRELDVEIYTQSTWPLPHALFEDLYGQELTLDIIEHSRTRFNYFENTVAVPRKDWQLRLTYSRSGVKAMTKLGAGQQVKTIDWGYHAMDTLATVFSVADKIYS
jgi:hypothetical protein